MPCTSFAGANWHPRYIFADFVIVSTETYSYILNQKYPSILNQKYSFILIQNTIIYSTKYTHILDQYTHNLIKNIFMYTQPKFNHIRNQNILI